MVVATMLVLLKMNWLIYSETKTSYDGGNPEIRREEQVTNQKPNNSLIALPLEIIYGPSCVLFGFVCLFVGSSQSPKEERKVQRR